METAVVTGASSGLGRQVAARLAERGMAVYGLARKVELIAAIDGVRPVAVDLADVDSIAGAVADLGPVDILVNNAGFAEFAPIELTSVESAQRQMAVNALAPMELARCLLPEMRARRRGRIVNVSSVASRFSSPAAGWYHASKAALESASDSLRQEVARFGISVAIVQPGVVHTGFHDTALDGLEAAAAGTAYAELARGVAAYHRKNAVSAMASSIATVTEVIIEAATCEDPRTRYVVGKGSRMAMWVGSRVPDRIFDKLVAKQMA